MLTRLSSVFPICLLPICLVHLSLAKYEQIWDRIEGLDKVQYAKTLHLSLENQNVKDILSSPHLSRAKDRVNNALLSRMLQETEQDNLLSIPPCNNILGSLTADELRALSIAFIGEITAPETSENQFLRNILVDNIQFGIQIHRICAGCQDVATNVPTSSLEAFEEFCGSNSYGAANATFSALMILPINDDGEILSGTRKGIIDMHPTAIALVPSLMWSSFANGNDGGDETFLLQLDGIIASTGQVLIFPDYMGYAENANELYKGYTIKKAYETSCVPIVLWAQQYIQDLTNCSTALSTTIAVKGYSEGGLSALVLADAMHRLGWNVVAVYAGGGPYKMSADTTTKTFERIINGQYDMRFRHILALVGSSYSSTYRDLPNYRRGQDMLADPIRPILVNLVTNSTPEEIVREYMPYEDQSDLLDLLFNPDYLEFVNASVAVGNYDPCGTTSIEVLEERNLHLICQSFQVNDASELLQNVPYQVDICHSTDDEVVPFESVPDVSGNENVNLNVVSGSHNEAAGECIFGALVYFLSSFQTISVADEHSDGGCRIPEVDDSTPTVSPTTGSEIPVSSASGSSSGTGWTRWKAVMLFGTIGPFLS